MRSPQPVAVNAASEGIPIKIDPSHASLKPVEHERTIRWTLTDEDAARLVRWNLPRCLKRVRAIFARCDDAIPTKSFSTDDGCGPARAVLGVIAEWGKGEIVARLHEEDCGPSGLGEYRFAVSEFAEHVGEVASNDSGFEEAVTGRESDTSARACEKSVLNKAGSTDCTAKDRARRKPVGRSETASLNKAEIICSVVAGSIRRSVSSFKWLLTLEPASDELPISPQPKPIEESITVPPLVSRWCR